MKHYLAVFTTSPATMDAWSALPEAERKQREAEGVAAWKRWAAEHAASIVDLGGPLGRTRLVSRAGIGDIRNALTAYSVIQAESQEEAARLFLEHPHFTFFRGEGVEVMEVLPIPPA